jgi:hypothetical protein
MEAEVALDTHCKHQEMHRFAVNFEVANIFNRFFETQKSTRNGKNNAKIRALGTWRPRVYHRQINHDGALRDMNGPLRNLASSSGGLKAESRPIVARNFIRSVRLLFDHFADWP